MIIYKITNKLNGKCYIGQTVNKLKTRLYTHFSANGKSNNSYIKRAIKKYGKENFCVDIIMEYKTLEDLNNAEEYYIDWYNCLAPNGYNLHTGGLNHRPSEETRKKLSDSHMGQKAWNKGTEGLMTAWNKGLKGAPNCGFQKGHQSYVKDYMKKSVLCSNGKVYESITKAAKELNTSSGKICAVIKGKRNHTKGLTFSYVEKTNV